MLDAWLAEGAAQLADTLRAAGPDAEVWTPVPGETSVFWARRCAHETAIHRADATLALGAEFTVDVEVAIDALDEWMELDSLPQHFEIRPEKRELLGPGRTLHFHATDTAPEAAAEWLIDLTGDVIVWRRAHEQGRRRRARPADRSAAGRLPAAARPQRRHRSPRRRAPARLLTGAGRLRMTRENRHSPTAIRTGRTCVTPSPPSAEQLTLALNAVDHLIVGIRDDQWSAPTPCTDWTVHDLVNHLVGVNLVFAALLRDQVPPERGADCLGDNPAGAYRDSGVAVQAAFDQPGVLERTYHGPLGAATGAERLHLRIADLLAHGWDLARATGQPAELPEDLAEQALAFARVQLSTMPRTGRFGPAQTVADDAPAIDRLVAFLGRPVPAGR